MNPVKAVLIVGTPFMAWIALTIAVKHLARDAFDERIGSGVSAAIAFFIVSLVVAFIYNSIVNGIGKKTKIVLGTIGALVILAPVFSVYLIHSRNLLIAEERLYAVAHDKTIEERCRGYLCSPDELAYFYSFKTNDDYRKYAYKEPPDNFELIGQMEKSRLTDINIKEKALWFDKHPEEARPLTAIEKDQRQIDSIHRAFAIADEEKAYMATQRIEK